MGWDTHIPDPADRHVGARVRRRRKSLQMSREQLGAHVSLTFQQIQKHELGIDRIGAVKLFQIARALQAPLAYFFDGYATGGKMSRNGDRIGPLPRIRGENLRCRIAEGAGAHRQD